MFVWVMRDEVYVWEIAWECVDEGGVVAWRSRADVVMENISCRNKLCGEAEMEREQMSTYVQSC